MDIIQLIHDEIMAHRNMAIDHPDLLPWSQDRIDDLYAIKREIDHYEQPRVSPETPSGAFKFRDQRGDLEDSMATVREFCSREQLIEYLQHQMGALWDCAKIKIKPYGMDNRIGWDTHIVTLADYGVIGYTDRSVSPEIQSGSHPYGYCPRCGAPGVSRERRLDGDDVCRTGHTYRSRDALPRNVTGQSFKTPRQKHG